MHVCTAAQMRELDRLTIEDIGIPGVVLMENAGRAVVDLIAKLRPLERLRAVVLCGPGNNGGDGYVIARHLLSQGARVRVFLLATREKIKGDALINLRILEQLNADVRVLAVDEDLKNFSSALTHAEVLVDALLGTGLGSEVQGKYREVIEFANRSPALKIAVDIPSGLHGDTGQVMGVFFGADHTVTFGYPKLGLVTHPGAHCTGQLHVADIGIPSILDSRMEFAAELLEAKEVSKWLLPRPAWGNKGTFGHLLILAGSPGKTGAALLCGEAALRSGAGLATIACPTEALRALECKTVEVMLAPLGPREGCPIDDSDEQFAYLRQLLKGKTAIAIGPGIAREPHMKSFVRRLIRETPLPLVIDADALNDLADDLSVLKEATVPILLTPHPGEMSRLLKIEVSEIQANRTQVARDFSKQHGVYLALKGAHTVIAAPDGKLLINPTGNCGMASAGTGDVLTGLVGGFLAQHQDPLDALGLGVFVHGLAGDRTAAALGSRAMLASDLLHEVGNVLKEWE